MPDADATPVMENSRLTASFGMVFAPGDPDEVAVVAGVLASGHAFGAGTPDV